MVGRFMAYPVDARGFLPLVQDPNATLANYTLDGVAAKMP